MSKIQELLAAKLATRLEAVLASQLDAVLDRAIDAALDRLLGEPAPAPEVTATSDKPKAKAKAKATPAPAPTSTTTTNDASTTARVRVEPSHPTHPTSYEEFATMLASLNLGVSASGKALSDLWANRAVSIAKHYGEEAIPWGKLWALVARDPKLPTKGTGSARAIAEALGLPVA